LAVGVREGTMVSKISVARWKIVLLICGGATFAACATGGSGGIQPHPRLRQAYFAKTVPVTGHYLREYNLPPKVSQFDSTSDTEVILVIQLWGMNGATVRGTLTDGRGPAKPFEQTLTDLNPPTSSAWRFTTIRFPTADLRSAPGEYAVDLFIDGIPSGTYKFILK
jgi:hypothetical protein